MTAVEDRYTRQRRLPEVGEVGQTRLRAASVRVAGHDGVIIEVGYLHRAGIERVDVMAHAAPTPFPHASAFRFSAACSVGAGAWRALEKIRVELGLSGVVVR